jgi:hypothetical protein
LTIKLILSCKKEPKDTINGTRHVMSKTTGKKRRTLESPKSFVVIDDDDDNNKNIHFRDFFI